MDVSLFSQSLFALPLDEAIAAVAKAGFPAIELACTAPHFDLDTAQRDADAVAERIRQAGLEQDLESAETFIRLAPLFHTSLIKLTPGPPASADAQAGHWAWLAYAIDALTATAAQVEVRLAFETHMRQLTDTLEGARPTDSLDPPFHLIVGRLHFRFGPKVQSDPSNLGLVDYRR